MSNKGDGKQGKSGKSNGSKNGVKKNPAASTEAPKVIKPKGPKPDYKPKVKNVGAVCVAQTDIGLIWRGELCVVETKGMRFSVTKESIANGEHSFPVLNLLSAPEGTALAGINGTKTYEKVSALHSLKFVSHANPDSLSYKVQYQIWLFFDKEFREAGFKQERSSKPVAEKQKHVFKTSSFVTDFKAGKHGMYSFEKSAPRAVWRLKLLAQARAGEKQALQALVVEIVEIDQGHPLFGYAHNSSYIFHNQLSWGKMPDFKGPRAGECMKIWEFLTDLIANRRKEVVPVAPAVVAHLEEKQAYAEVDLATGEYCLEPA